jgi:hypothetical protein
MQLSVSTTQYHSAQQGPAVCAQCLHRRPRGRNQYVDLRIDGYARRDNEQWLLSIGHRPEHDQCQILSRRIYSPPNGYGPGAYNGALYGILKDGKVMHCTTEARPDCTEANPDGHCEYFERRPNVLRRIGLALLRRAPILAA